VIWYGLAEGIRDGILKDVSGNIQAYDFDGDATAYVSHVIRDFFESYGSVRIPNGASAKIALYFPKIEDLEELKPAVEQALLSAGLDSSICLVNTSDSSADEVDAFNRLNAADSPHRVILLVNKGTEGWNCPSLFACALVRKIKSSNNFVLQAASRCLRQVAGNNLPARIYLSVDNFSILDRQLTETYGESIDDLRTQGADQLRAVLVLRKEHIPPIVITLLRKRVIRKDATFEPLSLKLPPKSKTAMTKLTYAMAEYQTTHRVLQQLADEVVLDFEADATDAYTAAVDLAAQYRLDPMDLYDQIRKLYQDNPIPIAHLGSLAQQIETQTRAYEETTEKYELALALVKPDGFQTHIDEDGQTVRTADISYPKDKEHLLVPMDHLAGNIAHGFGFHYDPYNFDSSPEKTLFEDVLGWMNLHPDEVEDVYFTGGITDPSKTDFTVEYRGEDGHWHLYTPDFVIRRKASAGEPPGTGRVMVIEVKGEDKRADVINGEFGRKAMALRQWEELNPDSLKYEMVFAVTDAIPADRTKPVRRFIEEPAL